MATKFSFHRSHNCPHAHEKGQGLVEYALILVLVAVVSIGILAALGPSVSKQFCTVLTSLGGKCSSGLSIVIVDSLTTGVNVIVSDNTGTPVNSATVTASGVGQNISCGKWGSAVAYPGKYGCGWPINGNVGDPYTVSATYNGQTGTASGTFH